MTLLNILGWAIIVGFFAVVITLTSVTLESWWAGPVIWFACAAVTALIVLACFLIAV